MTRPRLLLLALLIGMLFASTLRLLARWRRDKLADQVMALRGTWDEDATVKILPLPYPVMTVEPYPWSWEQ